MLGEGPARIGGESLGEYGSALPPGAGEREGGGGRNESRREEMKEDRSSQLAQPIPVGRVPEDRAG